MRKKISKKKSEKNTQNQIVVRLESIDDTIKFMAESQSLMRGELKKEIGGLKDEMNEKFRIIIGHLHQINDELAELKADMREVKDNMINKKEFFSLEKRVLKLEKELEKQKSLVAVLAKSRA